MRGRGLEAGQGLCYSALGKSFVSSPQTQASQFKTFLRVNCLRSKLLTSVSL
jgi:hypothetical protein